MAGEKGVVKPEKIDLDKLTKFPKLSEKGEHANLSEKLSTSEKKLETRSVRVEQVKETLAPVEKNIVSQPITVSSRTGLLAQRAKQIDDILADGLNEVFLKMSPVQQKEFKKKGEETVTRINKLLDRARLQVNKIISLIRKWLQLIPGVNTFFLEQEAKLKADKIIILKDK